MRIESYHFILLSYLLVIKTLFVCYELLMCCFCSFYYENFRHNNMGKLKSIETFSKKEDANILQVAPTSTANVDTWSPMQRSPKIPWVQLENWYFV